MAGDGDGPAGRRRRTGALSGTASPGPMVGLHCQSSGPAWVSRPRPDRRRAVTVARTAVVQGSTAHRHAVRGMGEIITSSAAPLLPVRLSVAHRGLGFRCPPAVNLRALWPVRMYSESFSIWPRRQAGQLGGAAGTARPGTVDIAPWMGIRGLGPTCRRSIPVNKWPPRANMGGCTRFL